MPTTFMIERHDDMTIIYNDTGDVIASVTPNDNVLPAQNEKNWLADIKEGKKRWYNARHVAEQALYQMIGVLANRRGGE